MDNEKVSLSYFNTIKVIGKGSFAKVVLVKKKGSENLYAMKILKKKYIEKLNKQRYAMIERDILKTMDHPFIVKMYHSFQNNKKLFFILEYCPGGELFNILSQRRKIPEAEYFFFLNSEQNSMQPKFFWHLNTFTRETLSIESKHFFYSA